MFTALLKTRMAAMMSMWFRGSKSKKQRSVAFKVLIGIFAVYVVGCMFLMFGMMFSSILPLAEAGLGWLYFAMAGIMAFALCFIGSVFTAQQQLFASRDNELLLSMPIPPAYILGSRMVMLLALNLLFEALVMLPAGVIWCMSYRPDVGGVILFLLGCLLLPLLAMTFSCVLGWLLTLLMNRIRNKSLITTVFSLAFLGAYFYVFGNINQYMNLLMTNGESIGAALQRAVYPAWAFGTAIANESWSSVLGFAACCVLPFMLVYWILSSSFIHLTTMNRGAAKIRYRQKELKTSSAPAALLKKELIHFGSNGMYIMNAALGSFFTLAAAVLLIFYRDLPQQVVSTMPELEPYLGAAATVMICFLASTNIISAPSISLEGKNLWISKAVPVSAATVLFSKVNCHLVIALPPAVLASLSVIFVLHPSPVGIAAALFLPVTFTVFCALLGVVVNLHFPKFDYINDVAAVKQGISSIICMFGSMGAIFLPAMLYFLVLQPMLNADLFLLLVALVLAAVCFGMSRWIRGNGSRRFEAL